MLRQLRNNTSILQITLVKDFACVPCDSLWQKVHAHILGHGTECKCHQNHHHTHAIHAMIKLTQRLKQRYDKAMAMLGYCYDSSITVL